MAFKLDKQESKRREELLANMKEAESKLEDAVSVYNAALAEQRTKLEAAVTAFNETVAEARGFAEDIARAAEEEIDGKSEKWQEGDKGQAATEWKDAWENVELDDVEVEWPGDLEIADYDQRASN